MESTFLQFLTASPNRPTIHVAHGLKQCRVKLSRVVCFGNCEFWQRCIKLQLEALEQDRAIDAAFRATPAQDAISQDKLYSFSFTLDSTIERIKRFEDSHRGTRRLFRLHPFTA